MSVNFHLPTVCNQLPNLYRQQNLLNLSLEVKQPTIEEINSLHFLLNINTFFPTVEIETIVPGRQKANFKREFAPLHLVFKQLSKLQTFSSQKMYQFITVTLGLHFSESTNETTPISVQWTYLHCFLQFLSPIALFPVEGGHCTMAIMKFMSGLRLDSSSPQSLAMSIDQQKMKTSLP